MNSKRLQVLYKLVASEGEKKITDKGYDYASEEEALGNGKKVSAICKILGLDNSPKAIFMMMQIYKIVREVNLWTIEEPKNEPIIDSVIDKIVYAVLTEAARLDELNISDKLIPAEVKYSQKISQVR